MGCAGSNIAAMTRAGVAILDGGSIESRKCMGRIANLAELIQNAADQGQRRHLPHALGHARRRDRCKMRIRISTRAASSRSCHNGVIENYDTLQR